MSDMSIGILFGTMGAVATIVIFWLGFLDIPDKGPVKYEDSKYKTNRGE